MADETIYTLTELKKRSIKARGELRRAILLLSSAAAFRELMWSTGNYAPHEIDTELQSRLDVIKPIVDRVAIDFKTGTNNSTPTTRINWDFAHEYFPGLIDDVRELTIIADVGSAGTSATIVGKLLIGKTTGAIARVTSGFIAGEKIQLKNSTDEQMNGTYTITSRNVTTGLLTLSDEIPTSASDGSIAVDDATMTLLKVQR